MPEEQLDVVINASLSGDAAQKLRDLAAEAAKADSTAKQLSQDLYKIQGPQKINQEPMRQSPVGAAFNPTYGVVPPTPGPYQGPQQPGKMDTHRDTYNLKAEAEAVGKAVSSMGTPIAQEIGRAVRDELARSAGGGPGDGGGGGKKMPHWSRVSQWAQDAETGQSLDPAAGGEGGGAGGAGGWAKMLGGRHLSRLMHGGLLFAPMMIAHAAHGLGTMIKDVGDSINNTDLPAYMKPDALPLGLGYVPGVQKLLTFGKGIAESYTSIPQEYRDTQRKIQGMAITEKSEQAVQAEVLPMKIQVATAHGLAASFKTVQNRALDEIAVDAVANPWRWQQEAAKQPLYQEQARKQREKQAAWAGVYAANEGIAAAQRNLAVIKEDERNQQVSAQWFAEQKDPRHANEHKLTLDRLKDIQDERVQAEQELKGAQGHKKDEMAKMEQAESGVRKADIALKQNEYAIVQEKETRIRGSYEGIGGLDPASRQFALQALDQLKQYGSQGLTPEQLQLIGQVGGQRLLQTAQIEAAANDPTTMGIQQHIQGDDKSGVQTLGEIVKDKIDVNAQVQLALQLDEQKVAEAIEPYLRDFIKKVTAAAEAIAAINISKIQTEAWIKAAHGG
jgi:hypothetical protein